VLYRLVIEHFREMWTIVATLLSFAVSLSMAWFVRRQNRRLTIVFTMDEEWAV